MFREKSFELNLQGEWEFAHVEAVGQEAGMSV